MRLINTTNSHHTLVEKQLKNTDAILVEVYSVGNTDVVFSKAPSHYELLITNSIVLFVMWNQKQSVNSS